MDKNDPTLVVFSLFFVLILCAGLVLNVLLVISILINQKLREKSTNHFIVAILACDVFLTISAVIRLSEKHLEFLQFSVLLLMNVQIGFTADRLFVICFPLTYFMFRDTAYRKWIIAACFALTSPWPILFYSNIIVIDHLETANTVNTMLAVTVILIMFGFMKAEISKMVRELLF
jgi:hypothetical protein